MNKKNTERNGKRWSTKELIQLDNECGKYLSIAEIAENHHRTENAIMMRILCEQNNNVECKNYINSPVGIHIDKLKTSHVKPAII